MLWINNAAEFAIPFMIILILSAAFFRRVGVYQSFTDGAEDGIRTVVKIFPVMTAILVAVAMMRESGLGSIIIGLISPVTDALKIPAGLVPLMLLRPVSGGGSLGILTDMLAEYGADSFIGRCASVITGSTETTLYTIMVYFSATRAKYTRCTLPAAILADILGMTAGVYVCRIFFGG
ncbi:MAG: spore maturation protein [Oscillospiraceae bacterium]|nr:spore maturation protein [Oscillospiraceae bacterium]